MDEKFETACFQIITYVGTARTHFINAIQCAKEGKYDEAAGQTVFHFHMHLIPRYEGDNAGIAAWKQGTLEDAVKEQIIESVTAELKA